MKKLIILSSFIVLAFANCTDSSSALEWYAYNETQCADPWQTGIGSDEATVLAAVDTYLDNLGITIQDSSIDSTGQAEACLACTCLSGRVIHVQTDASNSAAIMAEGFVLE